MYYPDLTCYRDGEPGGLANVYPAVKNIGWLDKDEPYTKGVVEPQLVQKLKEILFLDIKNSEDKKKGVYNDREAIIIHLMHMRGSPYKCLLCEKPSVINIAPNGLTLYTGKQEMTVGLNEVCIPSLTKGEFYSFPTMLYHYIVEHGYKPPQGFLNALGAFDLNKPYDIDSEQENLDCIEMPGDKVNSFFP